MNDQPAAPATNPISDDTELAKALAGISAETEQATTPTPTPAAETPAVTASEPATAPSADPTLATSTPTVTATSSESSSDLESIKKTALNELRPLIDHVDLPAEEKFDTYIMLIRSTDDTSLIAPAHAVAQSITDEKRRAEALLDIVKEIDFLTHKDEEQS